MCVCVWCVCVYNSKKNFVNNQRMNHPASWDSRISQLPLNRRVNGDL